jgi:hypothetical protein
MGDKNLSGIGKKKKRMEGARFQRGLDSLRRPYGTNLKAIGADTEHKSEKYMKYSKSDTFCTHAFAFARAPPKEVNV